MVSNESHDLFLILIFGISTSCRNRQYYVRLFDNIIAVSDDLAQYKHRFHMRIYCGTTVTHGKLITPRSNFYLAGILV